MGTIGQHPHNMLSSDMVNECTDGHPVRSCRGPLNLTWMLGLCEVLETPNRPTQAGPELAFKSRPRLTHANTDIL